MRSARSPPTSLGRAARRLGMVLLCALALAGPAADAQVAEEHELKAAFLYNFTRFVEWPADAFAEERSPFRICVVGSERLADFLEQLVAAERVKGRAIEVARPERLRNAASCQMLYLPADEETDDLPRALPDPAADPVLTVGESDDFLAAGGILRFRVRRGRIRLEVSDPARERSRLRMSSKLLQLCDLVRPPPDRRGD